MMKQFFKLSLIIAYVAAALACSSENTEESQLQSSNGFSFRICNYEDIPLLLLKRNEIENTTTIRTTISGWFRIPSGNCVDAGAWDFPTNTYYVQSENGRYIPNPVSSYAYDLSNEGIICLDTSIKLGWTGNYSYDGYKVFASGKCEQGKRRVPSFGLKRSLDPNDFGGVLTFRFQGGKFDSSDKLSGSEADPNESPLDLIKKEIEEVKTKIAAAEKKLQKCSDHIDVLRGKKIFSLSNGDISILSECSETKLPIKQLIDKAKEQARVLLNEWLDAGTGFFMSVLSRADTTLSDIFGFDQGALTSYLTDSGSDWARTPNGGFASGLNQALDDAYGKDHKLFLQNAHDGLKILVSQGQEILSVLNDEDNVMAYLQNSKSVREHLEGREIERASDLDNEGWPKDSPVPTEVRQAVRGIVNVEKDPADIQRAERLELILKQWRSVGIPDAVIQQRLAYMEAIKDLGAGFVVAASQAPEALNKLRDILDGAIEAAKDVTACLTKVGVSGDFSDWYEVTRGKDYCSGEPLSIAGRAVSAAGLFVGSGKLWRLMAESVGIAVHTKRVFSETVSIFDSAKRIGLNSTEDFNLLKVELKATTEVAGGAFDAAGKIPRIGRRTVLFQGNTPTCGPTSCGMVLDTFGKSQPLDEIVRAFNVGPYGVELPDIAKFLNSKGVNTSLSKMDITGLKGATANGNPAIAFVRRFEPRTGAVQGHVVVVDGITTRYGMEVVAIRDPWGQQYFQTITEFSKEYGSFAFATKGVLP